MPYRIASVLLLLLLSALALCQNATVAPSDRVRLTCEEEPTLNRDYTITKDGLILVDFIGAVKVAGLTEVQAAEAISAKLVEERVLRRATIKLRVLKSLPKSVRFTGAVAVSGETPLTDGMRLSDVLKIAGPTEAADLTRVSIRPSSGKAAIVDFTQYKPDTNDNNPLMKSGDEVVVPAKVRADQIVVLGGVNKPGILAYEKGMTARKAIEKAGGYSELGRPDDVKLERKGEDAQVLNLYKPGTDMELRPDDKLIVGLAKSRGYITVTGAVLKPGTVTFMPGMGVRAAIEAAGGVSSKAKVDSVKVQRAGQKHAVTVNYAKVAQGLVGDTALEAGDVIDVPVKRGRAFPLTTLAGVLFLVFAVGR